jgi:hypothetical protein
MPPERLGRPSGADDRCPRRSDPRTQVVFDDPDLDPHAGRMAHGDGHRASDPPHPPKSTRDSLKEMPP